MPNNTDYVSFYDQYMDNLKQKAVAAVKKAANLTYIEYFEYVEQRAEEVFKEVIQNFYDSYSPEFYDRHYSMFDLMKSELDYSEPSLSVWFEPSEMTSMRSGYDGEDGLYNQVFRRGWHGGAERIASDKERRWGKHPNPGVPYWRTPYPFYKYWGRAAEIADTPPLIGFQEMMDELQKTEFDGVFNNIWRKNASNIKIS